MKIQLGQKVTDRVSGFSGVAISRHEYLNGCTRISVQPPVDKEGKLPETQAFDEPQLDVIAEATEKRHPETGGPSKYMPKARATGERHVHHR